MPLHRLSHCILALVAGALILVPPSIATAQLDLPQGSVTCFDAGARFPGSHSPRDAVQYALMDLGYNPFKTNPFVTAMLDSSPKIVAGWVAVSLLREHRGYPAPTLGEWLGEGNTYGFSLAASDWNEMVSWPPDTCEGAFVQYPGNADVMQLVRSLVQTSRPSDFAPLLAPYTPAESPNCADPAKVILTDFAWKADGRGFMYVTGRLYNSCEFTVRAWTAVTVQEGERDTIGDAPRAVKLGPGEAVTFTDHQSSRVFRSITRVTGEARWVFCPERIC